MGSKIIVANWKMNPATVSAAVRLAKAYDKNGVVIAPPFVFLEAIGKVLKKAALGAQDVFWEIPPAGGGPFTGSISPRMLKNLGVKYVMVGHSERRRLGETDATVNKKVKAALAHGLKVILCVGEKLEIRKKGIVAAKSFVKNQLLKTLSTNYKLQTTNNLIVAYEPVWAVGTGKNDTPKNASGMANFIKRVLKTKNYKLKTKVLYGGSVKSKNAQSFLAARDIDGLLVGGASLKVEEFRKIVRYASHL